jgi:hypothetical protein
MDVDITISVLKISMLPKTFENKNVYICCNESESKIKQNDHIVVKVQDGVANFELNSKSRNFIIKKKIEDAKKGNKIISNYTLNKAGNSITLKLKKKDEDSPSESISFKITQITKYYKKDQNLELTKIQVESKNNEGTILEVI